MCHMEHNAPEVETTDGFQQRTLTGVIGCSCGGMGHLIPPRRAQDDTMEPYDERESNP